MLFFISHPIQYVSPLLKELSVQTDLKVYYYCGQTPEISDVGFGQKVAWDIPLFDGYKFEFLRNLSNSSVMNASFLNAINFSVFKVLRQSDDNIVVVNGWSYMSDWFVFFAAKIFNKKVWLRSEMPWNQEVLKINSFKRSVKNMFFKYILFKYFIDKYLYIGTQNKLYYLMYGVKESDLIFTPYAVDNKFFQSFNINTFLAKQKWKIREDQVVILYSGKLIEKKRPLDLLKAFNKLEDCKSVLFFMGDGPLRHELETYIKDYQVKNVIISGFINQSEIGSIYSMADLFVMCSGIGETWGLSVNEAMNFGLPVIVSDTCGSSIDLVENAVNGFVFGEGDIDTLSSKMKLLIEDTLLRNRMGVESKKIVNQYSHQLSCDNIRAALSMK